jgi:predicted metal-dependent phosphoesterase TrpH
MGNTHQRCDLHVHSLYSTDSGNYALRRARLGESYTEPERVFETCLWRGMTLVTITDHNTAEGALRIADRPNAFVSEEVTTRFPEDAVPLHVLVWDLTEEDHRDLQEYRPSVYELVDFLIARSSPAGPQHDAQEPRRATRTPPPCSRDATPLLTKSTARLKANGC